VRRTSLLPSPLHSCCQVPCAESYCSKYAFVAASPVGSLICTSLQRIDSSSRTHLGVRRRSFFQTLSQRERFEAGTLCAL
jgi:hypothetical protein